MEIAWFRDLVICVWGLIATLLLIFVAVILFLLYKKAKVVLNSIENTSETINRISSTVETQVIKPIAQLASLIQGIRQGIDFIMGFFKKSEEKGGQHG